MDARTLYERLERDPKDFPLFARVWDVLNLAPSSKHADEEELVSLTWDAFDYLQATGRWTTSSTTGRTEMFFENGQLRVKEDDDRDFKYQRTFTIH